MIRTLIQLHRVYLAHNSLVILFPPTRAAFAIRRHSGVRPEPLIMIIILQPNALPIAHLVQTSLCRAYLTLAPAMCAPLEKATSTSKQAPVAHYALLGHLLERILQDLA